MEEAILEIFKKDYSRIKASKEIADMYPRSTSLNRQDEITLKMSRVEFRAMLSMIEDNATLIGVADLDFCKRTISHVKKTNKMLKRNGIKREIKY